MRINTNYLQLSGRYLFAEIARQVSAYKSEHPEADIIRLGIGDVTRPLPQAAIDAMHRAVDEYADTKTFRGYGPEQGYDFLIDAIIAHDFASRGITLDRDEVFVSDGAKSDTGNIGDILSTDNIVGITDPVYPVYVDTNIMAGRRLRYIPCHAGNDFTGDIPKEHLDIIYLCYPNNPTGAVITREKLAAWVDYALREHAVILYDAAYEAFIQDGKLPHSIYEIEGAKQCAIEFRSFSKTAGFTGVRCGYTVIPKELKADDGTSVNALWNRRQCSKFNGASYTTPPQVSERCATSLTITCRMPRSSVPALPTWVLPSMVVSTRPTSGYLLPTERTPGTSSAVFSPMPMLSLPQAKVSVLMANVSSASQPSVRQTTVVLLSFESGKSYSKWNNSSMNVVWR